MSTHHNKKVQLEAVTEISEVFIMDVGEEEDDLQVEDQAEDQAEVTRKEKTIKMKRKCLNHPVLVSNPLTHATQCLIEALNWQLNYGLQNKIRVQRSYQIRYLHEQCFTGFLRFERFSLFIC